MTMKAARHQRCATPVAAVIATVIATMGKALPHSQLTGWAAMVAARRWWRGDGGAAMAAAMAGGQGGDSMDEAEGGMRRRQWRCVGTEILLPLGVRRGVVCA